MEDAKRKQREERLEKQRKEEQVPCILQPTIYTLTHNPLQGYLAHKKLPSPLGPP